MTDTDNLQDLDNYFTLYNSIALLLLKEGDKPGVLIMAASEEQKNKIEEICEDEGWYWRAYIDNETSKGVIENLKNFLGLSSNNPLKTSGLFVTDDEKRFEILEKSKGSFYGLDGKDVGKFLGYGNDAIKFYTESTEEDTPPARTYTEKIREMLETGEFDKNDVKHLQTILYVPKPDREHIKQAVKKGRKRWKNLRSGRNT